MRCMLASSSTTRTCDPVGSFIVTAPFVVLLGVWGKLYITCLSNGNPCQVLGAGPRQSGSFSKALPDPLGEAVPPEQSQAWRNGRLLVGVGLSCRASTKALPSERQSVTDSRGPEQPVPWGSEDGFRSRTQKSVGLEPCGPLLLPPRHQRLQRSQCVSNLFGWKETMAERKASIDQRS